MALKEFDALTGEEKACIQEVSTRRAKRVNDDGEAIIEEWVKIRLYDKQKSLDGISAMLGFDAPVRTEITGRDGREINGVQLIFSPTPLSPRDIEEIKKLQDGKTDSPDAGIQET